MQLKTTTTVTLNSKEIKEAIAEFTSKKLKQHLRPEEVNLNYDDTTAHISFTPQELLSDTRG